MGPITKTGVARAPNCLATAHSLAGLHADIIQMRVERFAPTVAQFDIMAKASWVVVDGLLHHAAIHSQQRRADWRQVIDAIMPFERHTIIGDPAIDLRIFAPQLRNPKIPRKR